MIETQALRKSFGDCEAVRDVSFRAADGRITGLLGPNGAGKSTTLKMLYTVLRPDSGTALIDGIDVVAAALEARRHIGVLPHSSGIYPRLTARENIEYFGNLQGLPRSLCRDRAAELIALLEMNSFADRIAKGYSQGQRLKTALARALVHQPRNLLLDEPTNGLDVMGIRSLRQLLERLRAQGHCILFSSHVMQEVAALCDEVVVVAHGQVISQGSLADIRQQTGQSDLETAFLQLLGSGEGLS
jgi:sodium transport system ATP-binding protein